MSGNVCGARVLKRQTYKFLSCMIKTHELFTTQLFTHFVYGGYTTTATTPRKGVNQPRKEKKKSRWWPTTQTVNSANGSRITRKTCKQS